MNWSTQQIHAIDSVNKWISAKKKPVFYLAGYAGTGKTELARYFAEGVNGTVLFASYTGKAACVLRQRGCPDATTIHRLIYKPREKSRERLMGLERQMADLLAGSEQSSVDVAVLQELIDEERKRLRSPHFDLNPDSPLRGAALLVIDEVSMVGERLAYDLLSFGVPTLVLGDPAQLPPVLDAGFFTETEPDVFLTEIHRQAADNPIVAMATAVRQGRTLEYGRYGESEVLRRSEFDHDSITGSDVQVLVGRNETRRRANARFRAARGFPDGNPVPGDRLVCLRNNHEVGLLNGAIWSVRSVLRDDGNTVGLDLGDDEGEGLVVDAHLGPFRDEEVPYWSRMEAEEFTWGYALTTHKAQGSQWPEVLVVDESACFRQDARRHLYTAITRAQEKVTVVR